MIRLISGVEIKGRLNGGGMTVGQIDLMFEAMSNTPYRKGPYSKSKKITINQFIKKHPEGRFFCLHKGHAFTVVDGVLHDYVDKPRRLIYYAIRVHPPHLSK